MVIFKCPDLVVGITQPLEILFVNRVAEMSSIQPDEEYSSENFAIRLANLLSLME